MGDINNDPRVGSSRDNSTTTTVAGSLTTRSNSASAISLVTTLIPVFIFAVLCVTLFLLLRRKYPRVYSPRTLRSILPPHERSPELPLGWFNWIKPFAKVPDTFVLNHSSLDGFLFLRYMKILCVICLVGCCITWPVLLPLHVHGGGTNIQLDLLTFGNVVISDYHYIHAFLAWIYFGFILYMVSRECVYYINLRHAYLLSPYYANRLSSRTVLFCCVPQQYLDEARLRKVFGDSVKNVWISRDTTELDHLVKEREQTALRLEKAEIVLIKKANEARKLAIKNGHPDFAGTGPDIQSRDVDNIDIEANHGDDPGIQSKEANNLDIISDHKTKSTIRLKVANNPDIESGHDADPGGQTIEEDDTSNPESVVSRVDFGCDGPLPPKTYTYMPPPDINGSVASQWLAHSSRPRHRPLANYGRRVDTIKWTRLRLKQLAPRINKLRKQQRTGKGKLIPAAFIEFDSQVNAQSAFQALSHHRAMHMSPRFIGVRPQEVVWSSLRMVWWERIIRRFSIQAFIAVMILFWSIPCAIISIISNVESLSQSVSFLRWIDKLPNVILGLISGLLPAIALSFWMSLLPAMIRGLARISGVPSLSLIELFCQNAYFVFQVVQVFLVTTLTSAASAAFPSILQDPLSVRTLLSENLPKASNFYVSYFILQGLASSASHLVHFPALFRHQILRNSSDNPRFLSRRWHRLRTIHWGGVFPKYTNMAVIAISYACIAPITLGFAAIGFYLVYLSYRYNLIYVYDSEVDTKGLLYPRALKQMLTGVYLAEICLLGLFGIGGSAGPLILIIILLVFTVLVHFSLSEALGPLLFNLPKTLAIEEDDEKLPGKGSQNDNMDRVDLDQDFDFGPQDSDIHETVIHGEQQSRAVEGAEGAVNFVSSSLKAIILSKFKTSAKTDSYVGKVNFLSRWISPDPNIKPNFLIKWLHPEIYADYTILRQMLPPDMPDPVLPEDYLSRAYYPPNMVAPAPVLWIPRDAGGVSQQEVAHTSKVIQITDEGAYLDEKNRIITDLEGPSPVIIEKILW